MGFTTVNWRPLTLRAMVVRSTPVPGAHTSSENTTTLHTRLKRCPSRVRPPRVVQVTWVLPSDSSPTSPSALATSSLLRGSLLLSGPDGLVLINAAGVSLGGSGV